MQDLSDMRGNFYMGRCEMNGDIMRALNGSELRRRVLFYLLSIYPYKSYISEIARNIRSDPSNVWGCLEGLGSRYPVEESLVGLALVNKEQLRHIKYFKINAHLIGEIKTLKIMYSQKIEMEVNE